MTPDEALAWEELGHENEHLREKVRRAESTTGQKVNEAFRLRGEVDRLSLKLAELQERYDELAAVQCPDFVDIPAGVGAPLHLIEVKEVLETGTRIFSYTFDQEVHLAKWLRNRDGVTDDNQMIAAQLSIAARMPIEGLRVGQHYTLRLNEYDPPAEYQPRTPLDQIMDFLRGGFNKIITEAECQKCGERFVVTGEEDDPAHPEHYTREDDTECGGTGVIIGQWGVMGQ